MNRKITVPIGNKISCKNWQIEAAYRMIQHNLDQNVAENPDELIVYGGKGKAARDWQSFDLILKTLLRLEADETLIVQSGKPVAVMKTHTPSFDTGGSLDWAVGSPSLMSVISLTVSPSSMAPAVTGEMDSCCFFS